MNKRIKDLTFKRFGRWIAFHFDGARNRTAYWRCRCDCGAIASVSGNHLRKGTTKSCGCLQKELASALFTTHGEMKDGKHSRLATIWRNMKQRCNNPKRATYKYYGGRGIKVCDSWHKFENFLKWAKESYQEGMTLDRRDNDGDYTPENCRWVTHATQMRNNRIAKLTMEKARKIRKLYSVENITQKALAEKFNVSKSAIASVTRNETWREDAA